MCDVEQAVPLQNQQPKEFVLKKGQPYHCDLWADDNNHESNEFIAPVNDPKDNKNVDDIDRRSGTSWDAIDILERLAMEADLSDDPLDEDDFEDVAESAIDKSINSVEGKLHSVLYVAASEDDSSDDEKEDDDDEEEIGRGIEQKREEEVTTNIDDNNKPTLKKQPSVFKGISTRFGLMSPFKGKKK